MAFLHVPGVTTAILKPVSRANSAMHLSRQAKYSPAIERDGFRLQAQSNFVTGHFKTSQSGSNQNQPL